ncbi:hypothetical protein F0U60_15245 [Archangium minus]|uniref:Uncharacterized protein n=1 Tax=Archangium minus TaxID=83450 RepID=A0ABY9WNK9_9BACT|nr:hypothetical protein F0U60_15245 [Archangium minus]
MSCLRLRPRPRRLRAPTRGPRLRPRPRRPRRRPRWRPRAPTRGPPSRRGSLSRGPCVLPACRTPCPRERRASTRSMERFSAGMGGSTGEAPP